ncbi:hypothetical protein HanRHA438_Chr02g0096801 [Helianthus annuus]|nr:hypothetical protein HanRHA438_Chr02g0096801 [Helianthus annuus]
METYHSFGRVAKAMKIRTRPPLEVASSNPSQHGFRPIVRYVGSCGGVTSVKWQSAVLFFARTQRDPISRWYAPPWRNPMGSNPRLASKLCGRPVGCIQK